MSPTRILLESDEAAPLTTVSGPTPAPEPADSGGDSFFAQAWNGSTEWLSSLTALQMVGVGIGAALAIMLLILLGCCCLRRCCGQRRRSDDSVDPVPLDKHLGNKGDTHNSSRSLSFSEIDITGSPTGTHSHGEGWSTKSGVHNSFLGVTNSSSMLLGEYSNQENIYRRTQSVSGKTRDRKMSTFDLERAVAAMATQKISRLGTKTLQASDTMPSSHLRSKSFAVGRSRAPDAAEAGTMSSIVMARQKSHDSGDRKVCDKPVDATEDGASSGSTSGNEIRRHSSAEQAEDDFTSNETNTGHSSGGDGPQLATINKQELKELVEEAFYLISTEGLSRIKEDEPAEPAPIRQRPALLAPMDSIGGVTPVDWKELTLTRQLGQARPRTPVIARKLHIGRSGSS